MTGMKVAISLPDPVFRAAETLARKLKKSRSQLYAEAIAEYVGARGATALTARLDAVYGKESSDVDPALKYAQLERLSREAW
jgi:metal-responsive CopG/Arc/MetJ family transcriptional regulator